MSKVLIPNGRTQKQPVTAFCRNPECLESSDRTQFEFVAEHQHVACPKCGADQAPMIGVLALVHFLYRDPKGPIVGSGGLRYALACDQPRAYLATIGPNANEEAATDQIIAVNCPGCLAAIKAKGLKDRQGKLILPTDHQEAGT